MSHGDRFEAVIWDLFSKFANHWATQDSGCSQGEARVDVSQNY